LLLSRAIRPPRLRVWVTYLNGIVMRRFFVSPNAPLRVAGLSVVEREINPAIIPCGSVKLVIGPYVPLVTILNGVILKPTLSGR
jgi:hypothetical protein